MINSFSCILLYISTFSIIFIYIIKKFINALCARSCTLWTVLYPPLLLEWTLTSSSFGEPILPCTVAVIGEEIPNSWNYHRIFSLKKHRKLCRLFGLSTTQVRVLGYLWLIFSKSFLFFHFTRQKQHIFLDYTLKNKFRVKLANIPYIIFQFWECGFQDQDTRLY